MRNSSILVCSANDIANAKYYLMIHGTEIDCVPRYLILQWNVNSKLLYRALFSGEITNSLNIQARNAYLLEFTTTPFQHTAI